MNNQAPAGSTTTFTTDGSSSTTGTVYGDTIIVHNPNGTSTTYQKQ